MKRRQAYNDCQDIDPGIVSWDDNNYNIICIAHLGKDDINFIRVQFSMTENHAKIAKKKFK